MDSNSQYVHRTDGTDCQPIITTRIPVLSVYVVMRPRPERFLSPVCGAACAYIADGRAPHRLRSRAPPVAVQSSTWCFSDHVARTRDAGWHHARLEHSPRRAMLAETHPRMIRYRLCRTLAYFSVAFLSLVSFTRKTFFGVGVTNTHISTKPQQCRKCLFAIYLDISFCLRLIIITRAGFKNANCGRKVWHGQGAAQNGPCFP